MARFVKFITIVALVLSPCITGALEGDGWLFILAVPTLVAALSLGGVRHFSRWQGPALALVSTLVTVTAVDLLLRPILGGTIYHRPYLVHLEKWPPMPWVHRFTPNYHWSGRVYGDLASSWHARRYREYRQIDFITDTSGYRNDLPGGHPARPLDVVVLGDSFGEGEGATQARIWPELLRSRYHLETYNLSIEGISPWEEFANLATMEDHLPLRPGTTVVWTLFNGNDLFDEGRPVWDPAQFPRLNALEQVAIRWDNFRHRSAIAHALEKLKHNSPPLAAKEPTVDGNPVRFFPNGQTILFFGVEIPWSTVNYAGVLQHPHFQPLVNTIRAVKRIVQQRQLKLVILLLPAKSEVYQWVLDGRPPWTSNREPGGFSRALSEICRSERIPFYDAKPALIDDSRRLYESTGESLWWRDDSHPNPRGQEAVAAYVHDVILGRG